MKPRPLALVIVFTLAAAFPSAATPRQSESDLPLFLEVRANGVPMVLKVVEGTTGTIESAGGVKVALIPKLTLDGVEIHAFDVFSIPGFSGEKAREVEVVKVAVLQTVRFANTKLDLEVKLIRSALPPVPPEWRLQARSLCGSGPASEERTSGGPSIAVLSLVSDHGRQQEPLAPCSRCCVTCDGITACWCEVWMSCGHCCCDTPPCPSCQG